MERIEVCPYCGQQITHTKLEEIQERIRKEEEDRLANLRKSHEQQLSTQRQQFQKELRDEREKALQKVKEREDDLKSREEKLRVQKEKLDEQKDAMRSTLEKEFKEKLKSEKEKIEAIVDRKTKENAEELQKANAKVTRLEKESAKKLEEGKVLARQEFDRDKRKLQQRIEEMEKQLEKKTSEELGSINEEGLFDLLKSHFPQDDIKRVPKGEAGADIKHHVLDRGVKCGLIIYECKNVKNWLNDYWDRAKKFRSMYGTKHIVIVSTAFPGKEKELFLKDDIIVVHPLRAIHIIQLLRESILELRRAKLSLEEQESKIQEIYSYLSGEDFKVQVKDIFCGVDDLRKIQTEERSKHERWWTTQTEKHQIIQNAATKVQSRISRIIESTD